LNTAGFWRGCWGNEEMQDELSKKFLDIMEGFSEKKNIKKKVKAIRCAFSDLESYDCCGIEE